MKSAILYGSPKCLTSRHRAVHGPKSPPYYVRMEVIEEDITEALNKAKPQPGETVLNTVEIYD